MTPLQKSLKVIIGLTYNPSSKILIACNYSQDPVCYMHVSKEEFDKEIPLLVMDVCTFYTRERYSYLENIKKGNIPDTPEDTSPLEFKTERRYASHEWDELMIGIRTSYVLDCDEPCTFLKIVKIMAKLAYDGKTELLVRVPTTDGFFYVGKGAIFDSSVKPMLLICGTKYNNCYSGYHKISIYVAPEVLNRDNMMSKGIMKHMLPFYGNLHDRSMEGIDIHITKNIGNFLVKIPRPVIGEDNSADLTTGMIDDIFNLTENLAY